MGVSWVFKPIAIASAVAFGALGLLSRRYEKPRLYYNVTLYLAALGLSSAWGVVVSIVATAAGQRLNIAYIVARSFYMICSPLVGWTVAVEGEEHIYNLMRTRLRNGKPPSAVIIGNHQSMLDLILMGRVFPKRTAVMAKKELKWTPLLGQYMALSGAVFIDRKNRKDAHRTVTQAGSDMKRRGISLWIFPEGTRSLHAENTMLPFKKGAFHLAIQAQVPIIPVVCENYYRLFDGSTRFNAGVIKVKVLPPVETEGLTFEDVGDLTKSTQALMLETLNELSPSGASKTLSAAPLAVETTTPVIVALEAEDSMEKSTATISSETESLTEAPSRVSTTTSTEDEMDEDAVLLKRPVKA